ncbi:MAG: lipopolysaccharide biosynthesis protein [Alistipes sp.]|nr:lipopolysaccharide biosynthesis protein [Alistipes sp.]
MKPNFWNRIFHYKAWKPLYFLRGFLRYYTPRWWTQRRLKGLLKEAQARPDWEYIRSRVDYYNRLEPMAATPEGLKPLAEHRVGTIQSAYFFDSHEYTRFFADHLRWKIEPGDVTTVPALPSVVKSRPTEGNLANSVVLNLDKHRHFLFLKDEIPFRAKQNLAIFRCNINYPYPNYETRLRFVEQYYGHPMCDIGVSNRNAVVKEEWNRPYISEYDHMDYKFVMCLEGIDVATNLKWVMSSNSLAVMPPPRYETWFMEAALIPNYHYVAIKADYSDLEERLQYYIDHPEEAETIVHHAHEWIEQFRDRRREKLISLLVLEKYFRQTHQL